MEAVLPVNDGVRIGPRVENGGSRPRLLLRFQEPHDEVQRTESSAWKVMGLSAPAMCIYCTLLSRSNSPDATDQRGNLASSRRGRRRGAWLLPPRPEEFLDEAQRRIGHFPPAAVDTQRVAPLGHADELRDALVIHLLLV